MRAIRNTLVLLAIAIAGLTNTSAQDPLPSWNDGTAKQAIIDFVRGSTETGGANFVAPEERIATFDMDGTLWVEKPMPTQAIYCFDRVGVLAKEKPEMKSTEPFKTILSGDRAALAKLTKTDVEKIAAATLSGMTTKQFQNQVKDWLATATDQRWKKPYTELAYQPMQEVLKYLRENGYKTVHRYRERPGFRPRLCRADLRHSARASCRLDGRNNLWVQQEGQVDSNERAQAIAPG